MKSNDITWFRPLWRRVAVTVFLALWCGWEWFNGETFWGVLVGAALAYSLYNFFYAFPADDPTNHDDTQPPRPPQE